MMALRFIERASGVTVRALLDLLGREDLKRSGTDLRGVEASARRAALLTGVPAQFLGADLARRRANRRSAQAILRRLPQEQPISGPLSDGQEVRLVVEATSLSCCAAAAASVVRASMMASGGRPFGCARASNIGASAGAACDLRAARLPPSLGVGSSRRAPSESLSLPWPAFAPTSLGVGSS